MITFYGCKQLSNMHMTFWYNSLGLFQKDNLASTAQDNLSKNIVDTLHMYMANVLTTSLNMQEPLSSAAPA